MFKTYVNNYIRLFIYKKIYKSVIYFIKIALYNSRTLLYNQGGFVIEDFY